MSESDNLRLRLKALRFQGIEMIKKILEEGEKVGFSTTEVYRKKITKTQYTEKENFNSSHFINTDRIIIRAFREKGNPVGFTLSTPNISKIRKAFHTMYSSFIPNDNSENFAKELPEKANKVAINIYDKNFESIDKNSFIELKEKLFEIQSAFFKGLKIGKISFSKMLKKVYLTNTPMFKKNDLKIKYRKTAYNLNIQFYFENNLIEIIDNKPFFNDFNPDKIISRAYNLLNSLTENRKISVKVKHLLFSPESASTILREFSDYFKLNSKRELKNITFPQSLSIIDNPLLSTGSNTVPFDDEGVQSSENHLIEKGFIKNRISNIKTGFTNNLSSTGNGFRTEKSIFPETKFTNLYIKPSAFPFSKLLNDGNSGILISLIKLKRIENGIYYFSAYGYEFENNSIKNPIHIFIKTTVENFFLSIIKVSKEIRFFYNRLNIGAPYLLTECGKKTGELFEL